MAPLKTLVAYLGGKARQSEWICTHLDSVPHDTYVEVCCGSAAVYFRKRPVGVEVLNDRDPRFKYLFRALRDHPEESMRYCSRIVYSRAAFNRSYHHLRGNPAGLPDWKLGCWALFQISASFSGYPDAHSFAQRVKGTDPAVAWARKVAGLAPYCERLRGCGVFRYDCVRLVGMCDRPGVLMYVDPPYFGAEFRYKVAKGFDHGRLGAALHSVKHAKVAVSHYDTEPYSSLYAGWRRDTRGSNQSCKGSTVHSPSGEKRVTECLWMNW